MDLEAHFVIRPKAKRTVHFLKNRSFGTIGSTTGLGSLNLVRWCNDLDD